VAKLYVTMLGGFSITYNGITLCEKTISSKKACTLIEYLITFRKKEITSLELFDVLWADDKCENPTSSLKTLLHRTRNILSKIEDNGDFKLIKSGKGSYFWNNDIEIDVDIDLFEEYYNSAKKNHLSDEERVEFAQKAIEIYKGAFLSSSSSEFWVIPLSTYYNSLFLEMVTLSVEILNKQNRFLEIVDISKNAISINPYQEDFYYNLISALYENGNSFSAVEHYKNVEAFFYSNFGVNLSDKFVKLNQKISNTQNDLEFNLDVIEENLVEKDKISGGFFCQFEFFKQQFQHQIRVSERKQLQLQTCLVSITNNKGKLPAQNKLNSGMLELIDILRSSLRSSDIFARYSVSQYVVLLGDTSFDNAKLVLNRINKNCAESVKTSGVKIKCDLKNYCGSLKQFVNT